MYTSDTFKQGLAAQPSQPAKRAFHAGYSACVGDDARAKREQRRYEIAKCVLAAIYGCPNWTQDDGTPFGTEAATEHARHAVGAADALLEALAPSR